MSPLVSLLLLSGIITISQGQFSGKNVNVQMYFLLELQEA